MISPFPFWPVAREEGSTVYKQRQNCRPYSNPWCSKKDTNSFLGEMQCPWQRMYLNWATELHCIRNTNKECKNGQSAKSTKPQVPQATSKPYSCALWVFKTIFFFPFLLSLIRISVAFGETNYLLSSSLLKRGGGESPNKKIHNKKTPTKHTRVHSNQTQN